MIREVRGRGLMIGVEFADHDTAAAVEQAAFRRGLLVLGCGDDAIRISPPLVFSEDQARRGARALRGRVLVEVGRLAERRR